MAAEEGIISTTTFAAVSQFISVRLLADFLLFWVLSAALASLKTSTTAIMTMVLTMNACQNLDQIVKLSALMDTTTTKSSTDVKDQYSSTIQSLKL